MTIRRLREDIEENPDEPRYLIAVPGIGYLLASRSRVKTSEEEER
jgi:DNA-binding response OmpR family regulator